MFCSSYLFTDVLIITCGKINMEDRELLRLDSVSLSFKRRVVWCCLDMLNIKMMQKSWLK